MRTVFWRMAAIGAVCAACSAARAENNVDVSFQPWNDPNAVQVVNDPDRGPVMQMTSTGPLEPADQFTAAAAVWTPDHITTLGDITNLSFDYKGTKGMISGGTPRFYLGLDLNGNGTYDSYYDSTTNTWVQDDGNVFIMAAGSGIPPWQEAWPSGWTSTGNVIGASQPMYDTSQVGGGAAGTWGVTYANTLTTVWNGPGPNNGKELKDIQVLQIGVVVDGGWVNGPDGYLQQMLLDGITYEGFTQSPSSPGELQPSGGTFFSEFLTVPVPEPSTFVFSLGGLAGLGFVALRNKFRRA